jgi:hypothetical protein
MKIKIKLESMLLRSWKTQKPLNKWVKILSSFLLWMQTSRRKWEKTMNSSLQTTFIKCYKIRRILSKINKTMRPMTQLSLCLNWRFRQRKSQERMSSKTSCVSLKMTKVAQMFLSLEVAGITLAIEIWWMMINRQIFHWQTGLTICQVHFLQFSLKRKL